LLDSIYALVLWLPQVSSLDSALTSIPIHICLALYAMNWRFVQRQERINLHSIKNKVQ